MDQQKRQFNVTAFGQDPIAGIAVDLEDAGKTREVDDRPFGLAFGGVDLVDGGRVRAAPGPVVAGIGPELAGLGAAASRIEYRCGRLIGKKFWRLLQSGEQPLMHWSQ
jgi:hypothetical protein